MMPGLYGGPFDHRVDACNASLGSTRCHISFLAPFKDATVRPNIVPV